MRRLLTLLAVVGFLVFWSFPGRSPAPVSASAPHIAGIVVPIGKASPYAGGNLIYHGGPVQTAASGPIKAYMIFWGTNFVTNTFASIVYHYFANVAHDSGKTSNVYYNDTQYYQTANGAQTNIKYSQKVGAYWQDTSYPAASDCVGVLPRCVTDADIQNEVVKAIQANNWPTGLNAEYFVFTDSTFTSCMDGTSSSCAYTTYCAYHGTFTNNSNTLLYANMPYGGYGVTGGQQGSGPCYAGNSPNNDIGADATINVVSHEHNETITDPEVNVNSAWYDALGQEIGDKCAWKFGTELGGSPGTEYNQVINGAHYQLQQEWSNHSSKCILTGT